MIDESNEQYDMYDVEATYVDPDESNVEYLQDPNVSNSSDFDLPNTLPPSPTEAADDFTQSDMEYVDDEMYEYDEETIPKVGMVQDVLDLTKNITSGNADQKAQAIETFSEAQIKRFTSPKIVGPLLMYWAFKGKLSTVERALIGAVGLGAALRGYSVRSTVKKAEVYYHPMSQHLKNVTNLSGR